MLRNLRVITGRPGWRLWWRAYLVFYTFCDFIVSYCFVPRASHEALLSMLSDPERGASTIDACLAGGRGLVVWTAHVANTEFASRLLELHGRPVNVARVVEPGNPAEAQLRDLMVNERLRVVDLTDPLATVQLLHALRAGEIVAMQGDRVFRGAGVERDVLRPADALPGGAVPPRLRRRCPRRPGPRRAHRLAPLPDDRRTAAASRRVRAARRGGAACPQAGGLLPRGAPAALAQPVAELLRLLAGSRRGRRPSPRRPLRLRPDEECIMPRHAAVAVTGIGAISPYGLGWEALLEGLSEGRSATGPISSSDNPLDNVPIVGQVTVPLDVEAPAGFRLSRTDRLALLAAQEASAPLAETPDDRRECAVVVSTTVAGLSDIDAGVRA